MELRKWQHAFCRTKILGTYQTKRALRRAAWILSVAFCDPEESALGLRYLADMGNYEEARSRRLKNGKGKGKGDEGEPGDGGKGKKENK